MQKKSALWLILTLSTLLSLLAACGTNTTVSNSTTTLAPTVPPGENIYVLDGYNSTGGASYEQQIVGFHPTNPNPTQFISLPNGLSSLDHQRLYTATPANGKTTISVINTQSGTRMRTFVIPGTYSTTGTGYDVAVLSASGQWLALRALGQSVNQTTIALVDTQSGTLTRTIPLNGDFTLDAISPGGKALYLLQRLNDTPGHYYVRVYDVSGNTLVQTPIVDKTTVNPSGDPNMTGAALARQMSADGTFAYTLYIDTRRNMAFIHVLPLNDQLDPPIAHCIDLPVGKSVDLLHYYTLALSADGSTLYAANGAIGVVNSISMNTAGLQDIFDDKIQHTTHFNPGNASISNNAKTRTLFNGAALSSDQKTLYFAGVQGIWAVNTSDLGPQGYYLVRQPVTGIALSGDDRTLYAVDPTSGITLLSAANGQTQKVIQGPAHNPWGIAWITH